MASYAVSPEERWVEEKTANDRAEDRVDLVVWLETAREVLQELFDFVGGECVGRAGAGQKRRREGGEGEERFDKL